MTGDGSSTELPNGWKTATLAEAAVLVRDKVDPLTVPDVPYIGLEHVEAQTMRIIGRGTGADVKSTKTRFRAGDVLYGKLRPYLNKVARPDFDGICSTDFLVFRESASLDAGYLANYLNQLHVADVAHQMSTGVELPRVDWTSLSALDITYPDNKSVQRDLVREIDRIREGRMRAEAHVAAARDAIRQLRRAVLAAAYSGHLTAADRQARGWPPPTEMTIAECLSDGLFIDGDWIESKDQDPEGDVRLIQLADVGDGYFRDKSSRFLTSTKARELHCTYLKPGDVLVARMPEPLGRACIFPGVKTAAVTAVDVCILRPGANGPDGRWLLHAINAPQVREAMQDFVRGTTRQRISRRNLGLLSLAVPSKDEQLEVARRVDQLLQLQTKLWERAGAAAQRIERSSQAVLSRALGGEFSPNGSNGGGAPSHASSGRNV